MQKIIFFAFLTFVSIQLGAHEVDDHLNRVSLSASAESEVENDLLVANLYSEHQSQQQKDVSEYVNKAVAWALEKSKKVDDVKSTNDAVQHVTAVQQKSHHGVASPTRYSTGKYGFSKLRGFNRRATGKVIGRLN